MARIKGIDSHGKVHWLREIRGLASTDFVWSDEIHASQMPLHSAEHLISRITQMNRYVDPDDRIEPTLVKEFSR